MVSHTQISLYCSFAGTAKHNKPVNSRIFLMVVLVVVVIMMMMMVVVVVLGGGLMKIIMIMVVVVMMMMMMMIVMVKGVAKGGPGVPVTLLWETFYCFK